MARSPQSLTKHRYACEGVEQQRRYDAQRADAQAWRAWYKTARWKRRRAALLEAEPLCCMCTAEGRIEPATVADHVTAHKGEADLFWHGPLQPLCAWHHDRAKQSFEKTRPTGGGG